MRTTDAFARIKPGIMGRCPNPWVPACLLLLLAGCGRSERAANNSVTVNLPPAEAPVPPESSYTSLDPASCTALGDGSGRRCPGLAGYALETGVHSLAIIAPDGHRSDLDLSKVVKGSRKRLGGKAEWRGAVPGRPTVLIVRVNRQLAVTRLQYPACIVAVVDPQAEQNEKAREVADGQLPACLKS